MGSIKVMNFNLVWLIVRVRATLLPAPYIPRQKLAQTDYFFKNILLWNITEFCFNNHQGKSRLKKLLLLLFYILNPLHPLLLGVLEFWFRLALQRIPHAAWELVTLVFVWTGTIFRLFLSLSVYWKIFVSYLFQKVVKLIQNIYKYQFVCEPRFNPPFLFLRMFQICMHFILSGVVDH